MNLRELLSEKNQFHSLTFSVKEISEDKLQNYFKEKYALFESERFPQRISSNLKKYILENKVRPEIELFIKKIQGSGVGPSHSIKVGDSLAVLDFEINFGWQEIYARGFTTPKKVSKISTGDTGSINYVMFEDGDRYPRITPVVLKGKPVDYAAYFLDKNSAEKTLTMLNLAVPDSWELDSSEVNKSISEKIERTGKGDTAVVGWGRGMGHKGHMYLASSVITHAKELGGDPYFVVSRTVGKDDPITPEEKLAIYKKVFPEQGHIFQTASDEMPDLTRVLSNLNQQGYRNAVVVVGADQVKAFQYLNAYNGKPNKAGEIPFNFDDLQVISRQMTSDPSKEQEGPRATPMRQVLLDPSKSDEEQFAVWRDAMNPEVSDNEVRDLMNKAKERMTAMQPAPKKTAIKKPLAVAEGKINWDTLSEDISVENRIEMLEAYLTEGSLKESVDHDKKRYFENLFKLSDNLIKNQKYIVVPLALVNNKIMPVGKIEVLDFLKSNSDGIVFQTDSGEKTYPPKVLRDLSVLNTFTFLTSQSYDKFRTALTLKFNTSLPSIDIKERTTTMQPAPKKVPPKKKVAEGESKAMAQTVRRLTDPKDGATAKLRAAGDKRREQHLKGRDIAKRDDSKRNQWGEYEVSESMITRHFKGIMKRP